VYVPSFLLSASITPTSSSPAIIGIAKMDLVLNPLDLSICPVKRVSDFTSFKTTGLAFSATHPATPLPIGT
jgi:hypothetical protein